MKSTNQLLQDAELDRRVYQKDGTLQCWWLTLLEIARDSGKLNSTFQEGIPLHTYYTANPRPPIPNKGGVPKGAPQNVKNNALLEVHGPKWQRMIMLILWVPNSTFS
jgi:hypothetical protein